MSSSRATGGVLSHTMATPLGPLTLVFEGEGSLVRTHFGDAVPEPMPEQGGVREVHEQLDAYFRGERRRFEVPLAPVGTPFQRRVWALLQEIPYGETWSYLELARRLGDVKAIRAVGTANGANPIGILIPCHRVIGSDGTLTGYAGGLERKRALLELETGRTWSGGVRGRVEREQGARQETLPLFPDRIF
ncbi:MAG: methylated-DNA--[protein]-cysteine S-methyltransferase [Myxococcota bacterium]